MKTENGLKMNWLLGQTLRTFINIKTVHAPLYFHADLDSHPGFHIRSAAPNAFHPIQKCDAHLRSLWCPASLKLSSGVWGVNSSLPLTFLPSLSAKSLWNINRFGP